MIAFCSSRPAFFLIPLLTLPCHFCYVDHDHQTVLQLVQICSRLQDISRFKMLLQTFSNSVLKAEIVVRNNRNTAAFDPALALVNDIRPDHSSHSCQRISDMMEDFGRIVEQGDRYCAYPHR